MDVLLAAPDAPPRVCDLGACAVGVAATGGTRSVLLEGTIFGPLLTSGLVVVIISGVLKVSPASSQLDLAELAEDVRRASGQRS